VPEAILDEVTAQMDLHAVPRMTAHH